MSQTGYLGNRLSTSVRLLTRAGIENSNTLTLILQSFVVTQTVCQTCIEKPLNPKSIYWECGTCCEDCDNISLWDNEDDGPCPDTCCFREVTFDGADTSPKFAAWFFNQRYHHFKVVAHNMKGYYGYFLLEYLIDHSICPKKIIYNGSKIMYMSVELGLHMQVIDSLNFLPK